MAEKLDTPSRHLRGVASEAPVGGEGGKAGAVEVMLSFRGHIRHWR